MSKKEQIIRSCALILGELFTVATIIMVVSKGQYTRLPMAVGTVFLLLIAPLSQRLLKIHLQLPLYLLTLFYALGPMLGQCYNLYYTLCWWDKLLHTLGGVMFALVGLFLFQRFVDHKQSGRIMAAVFALCFSMSISMLWEFCEFGTDQFFGTDMQQDTIITQFHSYLLGNEVGVTGSVEEISQVVVNGQLLPGYIDIGLYDTMLDMLLETLGAAAIAVAHLLSNGRWTVIKAS